MSRIGIGLGVCASALLGVATTSFGQTITDPSLLPPATTQVDGQTNYWQVAAPGDPNYGISYYQPVITYNYGNTTIGSGQSMNDGETVWGTASTGGGGPVSASAGVNLSPAIAGYSDAEVFYQMEVLGAPSQSVPISLYVVRII
jgi:hypothetical protein